MTKVKKNYLYNLIYQIFGLIIPLVITPYLSRVLGSNGIGQYSFAYSLATYFVLFAAFGFNTYAQREIARAQGDKKKQSLIFWEIVIARLVTVTSSLVVYFALIVFGIYGKIYTVLMLVLSANIFSTVFDITFLFQGNEEFGIIAIRNIIIKIIGIVGILIFVKNEKHVWIYAFCQAIIFVVSNLSLWTRLPKALVKVNVRDLKIKKHYLPTLRLFIPTVAISIYTMLNKTLLGVMIPGVNEIGERFADIENGYYDQSEKLIRMAMTVITSLGTVMIPRNSQAINSGDIEGFKKNIDGAIKFVFFLGTPIMFGLSAVAQNLSSWFFGPGYEKVPILIMMFSPLILLVGLSNVLGLQYLLPLKKDSKYTIAITCGAAFNLVFCLVLIPFFWSFGACAASIVAELIVTILMFLFSKKDVKLKKIVLSSWKYLVAGAMMFFLVFFTQLFLSKSISNTLLLVAEGVVSYLLMLLLLKDDFLSRTIKKAYYKIIKK